MFGITINGKHTFDEYGLKMTKFVLPMPEPKKEIINVPFSHGSIDLSDYNDGPHYNDRNGVSFSFVLYDKSFSNWATVYSKIANDIHGKNLKVIFDNDKAYYYMMRLSVSSEKSKKPLSSIVLTGTAEPFKYELASSTERWYWDTFNFKTGIIQNPEPLKVDGTESVVISKGKVAVAPTFIVADMGDDDTLTVNDGAHTINLKNGSIYDPRIKVNGSKDITLTFTGKGSVLIDYRKRSL